MIILWPADEYGGNQFLLNYRNLSKSCYMYVQEFNEWNDDWALDYGQIL